MNTGQMIGRSGPKETSCWLEVFIRMMRTKRRLPSIQSMGRGQARRKCEMRAVHHTISKRHDGDSYYVKIVGGWGPYHCIVLIINN